MTAAAVATATQSVIGVFGSLSEAETAVRQLDRSGFPIEQVSIVTKDLESEKEVHGYVTTGDIAARGAGMGVWVGGIFGLLIGAAFIWVPGSGPLLVAGPFATALLGALEGAAVGGAGGGLLGALAGLGVSRQHILKYEDALRAGKYLVIAHGTSDELSRARVTLGQSGAAETTMHPVGTA